VPRRARKSGRRKKGKITHTREYRKKKAVFPLEPYQRPSLDVSSPSAQAQTRKPKLKALQLPGSKENNNNNSFLDSGVIVAGEVHILKRERKARQKDLHSRN